MRTRKADSEASMMKDRMSGMAPRLPDSVRDVVWRSTPISCWCFDSVKMGGYVEVQSRLELRFGQRLDADPTVRAYYTQPETIEYELDGKARMYTPDFRVQYWSGRVIIYEVKPQRIAEQPWFKERVAIWRANFARRNLEFFVVTDAFIDKEPEATNAETLLYWGKQEPDGRFVHQVLETIQKRRPATLGELEAMLWPAENLRERLYAMALRGFFHIDLSDELSPDSRISLSQQHA